MQTDNHEAVAVPGPGPDAGRPDPREGEGEGAGEGRQGGGVAPAERGYGPQTVAAIGTLANLLRSKDQRSATPQAQFDLLRDIVAALHWKDGEEWAPMPDSVALSLPPQVLTEMLLTWCDGYGQFLNMVIVANGLADVAKELGIELVTPARE